MEEHVQDIEVEIGLRKPESLDVLQHAKLKDGEYIVKGAREGAPGYTQAQRRRVRQGKPVGALSAKQKRYVIGMRKKAGKQAMKMTAREKRAYGIKKGAPTRGKRRK
jgi:hypothetical protein